MTDPFRPASDPISGNYARVRALFDQCADLPEGERLGWIEQHVPDTATRMELALMLASDASSDDLFTSPALQRLGGYLHRDAVAPPDLTGTRCGPFRLKHLLGSGGQGAVYLAHREGADFSQQVAIKLMRRALLDESDVRRFRRERDILARFEHPGVARLIDAGVADNGLPYLAMEYVDGEPIDAWCQQHALDLARRLRLVEELCDVVASAHRQLIVHRDLKPSNVLVNGEGRIKVLDFGIARLLDEEGDTRTHAPMHTPGYGSPEQRNGDPVAPASDVYALGVMLRELATSQSPPRRAGELWPAWPATAPQELRWIFDRCCAAAPAERYRDAAELRDDLVRYRELRPVQAHPPSHVYAALKFMRRHRGGTALTALLLLTTLIGFGAALWNTQIAQQQSKRAHAESQRAIAAQGRAEAVRDFVVEVFETGGAGLPRDQLPDTATLLERGRIAALASGARPPETQAEMLTVLSRIYLGLQRENQALELADDAVATLEHQQPRNDASYAEALARRGELRGRLGRGDESIADFDAALGLQERIDPNALALARTLIARGEQRAAAGKVDEALADYERALRIEDAQADADPALRAATLNGYGIALWRVGDCVRAEAPLRQAVDLSRRHHGNDHAETAGALSGLSLCLTQSGKLEEAESVSRESLAILTRIFGAQHPALGQAKNNLANLLLREGKLREALPLLREKLASDHESGVDRAVSGLNTWINLSNALRNLGDLDGARDAADKALEIGKTAAADSPVGREPELLQARIDIEQGAWNAAQARIDSYRRWMATPEGAHAQMPQRVDLLEARIALERGHIAKADALIASTIGTASAMGCTEGARALVLAARLRTRQDRDAEAGPLLDRAVEPCTAAGLLHHFALGEALLARAEWRFRNQDRNGAQQDAAAADAALSSELDTAHPLRQRLMRLRMQLR